MARKNFATPIDEDLQSRFKTQCREQDLKMNEVIEALMEGFADGNIKIKKNVSYEIHQEDK